jgi:hypothetical protein
MATGQDMEKPPPFTIGYDGKAAEALPPNRHTAETRRLERLGYQFMQTHRPVPPGETTSKSPATDVRIVPPDSGNSGTIPWPNKAHGINWLSSVVMATRHARGDFKDLTTSTEVKKFIAAEKKKKKEEKVASTPQLAPAAPLAPTPAGQPKSGSPAHDMPSPPPVASSPSPPAVQPDSSHAIDGSSTVVSRGKHGHHLVADRIVVISRDIDFASP